MRVTPELRLHGISGHNSISRQRTFNFGTNAQSVPGLYVFTRNNRLHTCLGGNCRVITGIKNEIGTFVLNLHKQFPVTVASSRPRHYASFIS